MGARPVSHGRPARAQTRWPDALPGARLGIELQDLLRRFHPPHSVHGGVSHGHIPDVRLAACLRPEIPAIADRVALPCIELFLRRDQSFRSGPHEEQVPALVSRTDVSGGCL